MEIFHSAVGKCRLLMLVLDAYARYPTCRCWIARAPFLGAHTDCLSSELGNASCCLLPPAGFTEKYHRVLTEAQLSRMSGGIGVLILLFTRAVCVFPKPQNQPDTCLALPVLEQEACGLLLVSGRCLGVCCCSSRGASASYGHGKRVPAREVLTLPFSFLQNFGNKLCFFHYFSPS